MQCARPTARSGGREHCTLATAGLSGGISYNQHARHAARVAPSERLRHIDLNRVVVVVNHRLAHRQIVPQPSGTDRPIREPMEMRA